MAAKERTGCSGIIFKLFGIKPAKQENIDQFPYRLKDSILSPAESSFYHILKQMAGNYLVIFPQITLATILFVTDKSEYYTHYNKIDRKRVDYLLCDAKTLHPVLAIELDDASHQQKNRIDRDKFVESVLTAANLPFVRIPVRQSYNLEELGILFKNALQRQAGKDDAGGKTRETAKTGGPPMCPKCGVPMVMRTTQRGDRIGEKFWGCPNFPDCRMVVKISPE
ncbi:MAG: DNA topoisomerase type IA zn finger domain-containing protein [Anaerolineaceae bacterium]|nr:MAG: DNA topoisomerase type IA zn finger domain-containing protein [Anaerolineaceae bacterium]